MIEFLKEASMKRLTRLLVDNQTYVSRDIDKEFNEGYSGEAIERLAKFENLYEHLFKQHEELPKELEILRNEGKTKHYRFREKFGQKLTIEAFIKLLKEFDIE